MDRLEKEWFDLVCDVSPSISALTRLSYRLKISQNLT